MNKLVNIICALLLFGPVITGLASGDGEANKSNQVTYVPSTQR